MVTELANRGLGYGIHILAAANRWMDVRAGDRGTCSAPSSSCGSATRATR